MSIIERLNINDVGINVGDETLYSQSERTNAGYAQFKQRLGKGSTAVHYEVEVTRNLNSVKVGLHIGRDTDVKIRERIEQEIRNNVPNGFEVANDMGEVKVRATIPIENDEQYLHFVEEDMLALYNQYEQILCGFEV